MIVYTNAVSDKDLHGILTLQQKNLVGNLTEAYMQSQGFVTVAHHFQDLKKMSDIEPSIVAKKDEEVVAYVLAMTQQSKNDILVLVPMFEMFDEIPYLGKPVSAYHYLVVGQVCVDEAYRGKGIIDKCYEAYKIQFQNKYDFVVTEIAAKNLRSINMHQRIGFKEIHKYTAPDGVLWSVVIWDWRK